MRYLKDLLTLGPLLLIWTLTTVSAESIAFRDNLQQPLSAPFHYARTEKTRNDRYLLSRVRDSIIQSIWRIPTNERLKPANAKPSASRSSPPSKLLARYGGDLVLRFKIRSAEEAEALADAINVLFLDLWEFTAEWVDIRLSQDVVPSLLGLLPTSLQHAHTPLMHDLAHAVFESYPSPTTADPSISPHEDHQTFSPILRPSTSQTNVFFQNYQPLSVIVPWMRLLQSLFPSHVRMINVGVSYEGRDIPALRIGVHPTNAEQPSSPRKTVIITGGSHAREWISTSTVNYIAYSFITAYGKSRSMTKLLEKFDWIFIPTLNPDGYVYTWETDRLWRKNRQETSLRFCRGVDLDRAYGFEWDGDSSKNNPCSESFSGEEPFQGVEARRFANWVRNETEHNNAEIVAFLDFHSYSQQVLYPYAYSCTSAPRSLENLEELATGLAKAIRLTSGQTYGVTSACEGSVSSNKLQQTTKDSNNKEPLVPRMESGGGSALDWFYHEIRARYAYQIKLRDTGSYGFLLPNENIVPTGKEALSAVKYLGQFLLGNKGIESDEDEFDKGMVHGMEREVGKDETREVDAGVGDGGGEGGDGEGDARSWELRRRRRR